MEEDCCEFKTSVSYTVTVRPAYATRVRPDVRNRNSPKMIIEKQESGGKRLEAAP